MTTKAITPLRQRMIEDMNARKLCAGTQRGHILAGKRFAAFLKRSPDTATRDDIRSFQLHLADTGMSICNPNPADVMMQEYCCRNIGCFPAESLRAGRARPAISIDYSMKWLTLRGSRRA